MELDELRAFVTVVAERSFSRAAAKLYKTQPAISQAVRRLEDQLGERLLDRTTKEAQLTSAGAILLKEGQRLLQMADAATVAVRRHSERDRGRLRIGGDELGAHVLLPTIAAFLKRDSSVAIEFEHLPESDVMADVASGALDVGIVSKEKVPAGLQQLRIFVPSAGYSVIVPRGHRLAGHRRVTVGMLGEERAIVLMDTRGVGGDITAAIGRDAPHPFPIIGMPGIDSIKRAVEMGLGVGVIPRSAASGANSHQALVAIPLSGARATTMTLIYRKTDRISKATSAFVEAMRESRRSPNASGEAFR